MKRVLITGGAGFIGHHLVEHLQANTDWEMVVLATLRHKGDSLRTVNFDPSRVTYIHHDLTAPINDRLIDQIGQIDYVVNMASDSHVDRSITDPVPFVENNVSLALQMLEYARKVQPEKFIQVSTDEVYGPCYGDGFLEWSTILPSNPYSASKAAQEAIAFSYWRTYNVPLIITNTMNNFGERQDPEKFVGLATSKILNGEKMLIHANKEGKPGSRFYLHARNHADAILFLLKNHDPVIFSEEFGIDRPDRFNVTGDLEVDNLEMAQTIANILKAPLDYELVDFHSSRPGHDLRYGLDGSKLKDRGWVAPVPFKEALERTVLWTLDNKAWLK